MPQHQRIRFIVDIAAPVPVVFETMLDPVAYRDWSAAFVEGSHYTGTWQQGQTIRFMSPSGDGMVSEIAEHRIDAFTSIRHLGYIVQGVEDTTSEAARAWAPAYENYTFTATPDGTRLVVDQDASQAFEPYLAQAWPQALQRLKVLCEAHRGARSFRHSRLIDATPAQVFAAFSQPERLARWWGPDGFSSTFERFELRAGGSWQFVMHGPDGAHYPNANVFTRVEPPDRIEIEHLSEDHHFTLKITLSGQGSQTLVGWEQTFDSAAHRQLIAPWVEPANEQNLDRLQREVAGFNPPDARADAAIDRT